MSRFYWMLGIAFGLVTAAWTVSAQPTPPDAQPPGFPPGPGMMAFPPQAFASSAPPMGWTPPMGWAPAGAMPKWPLPPPPPERPGSAGACLDGLAHRAAGRAYLKARLDLTPPQLLIWQELETVAAEGEAQERQACANLASRPADLSIVQRLDTAEARASRQLAHLRKVNEPLKKLAATLSPEQRRLIDQPMAPVPF